VRLPSFWPAREGRDRQIHKVKGFDPSVPEEIIFPDWCWISESRDITELNVGVCINTKPFVDGALYREI